MARQKETRLNILLALVVLLMPPLGVAIKVEIKKWTWMDVLINGILTLLGWIPGLIHGLFMVFRKSHNHKQRNRRRGY